jgi:hypothetical protein
LTYIEKPIIINSFRRAEGLRIVVLVYLPLSGESLRRYRESKLLEVIEGIFFMAKRRGNPNWGKPEPIGPVTPTITEFEQVVHEYKLSPDQYLRSTRLREWARRNKNSKYIPEPLLEAWGFEIESTL